MLGSPQRPPAASTSSRASAAFRRRLVAAVLVALSLVLVTVYFRESEDGAVHSLQSTAADVLRPFEVAAERVARPFQDAVAWFDGLLDAKAENARLREENERLLAQSVSVQTLLDENEYLREIVAYLQAARFPKDFKPVTTQVIARPSNAFDQQIVVAAGSKSGIRVDAPVVTPQGLVGKVTKVARSTALVTLLTDGSSGVPAIDLRTGAGGIVRHGEGKNLILDRVSKEQRVGRGHLVVTSGWQSDRFSSIYPRGIAIGVITSASQTDTDLYKKVQIAPLVDFGSLEAVIVLVSKKPQPVVPR